MDTEMLKCIPNESDRKARNTIIFGFDIQFAWDANVGSTFVHRTWNAHKYNRATDMHMKYDDVLWINFAIRTFLRSVCFLCAAVASGNIYVY